MKKIKVTVAFNGKQSWRGILTLSDWWQRKQCYTILMYTRRMFTSNKNKMEFQVHAWWPLVESCDNVQTVYDGHSFSVKPPIFDQLLFRTKAKKRLACITQTNRSGETNVILFVPIVLHIQFKTNTLTYTFINIYLFGQTIRAQNKRKTPPPPKPNRLAQ